MKLSKKITAVITAATMFAANSVGFMPNNPIKLPAISASAADIVASGACGAEGDNVIWELDSEGTLTISGEGEMVSYYDMSPWLLTDYNIKKAIIEDGVTSIGSRAFDYCKSLI